MKLNSMRRIIKLGGSLLSREDLCEALTQWQRDQSTAQTLVVVGGGKRIDAIRSRDQMSPRDSEIVHWECIELLSETFHQVATVFPSWDRIETAAALSDLDADANTATVHLVMIAAFYNRSIIETSPLARSVPRDWTTTSDTLAAVLAIQWDADELVLLKSCDVPEASDHDLARLGIVDEAFPRYANRLRQRRIEALPRAMR